MYNVSYRAVMRLDMCYCVDMYHDDASVHATLTALERVLARRSLSYDLVVLGGASLVARRLTSRATGDIDVLGFRLPDGSVVSAYEFPAELNDAAMEVASLFDLPARWLDDRPGSDFKNAAPAGFEQRLELVTYGPALRVWHLARFDIATIKMIAAAERWGEPDAKHWEDVQALRPTTDEIEAARAMASRVWAPASAAWTALESIVAALGGDDDGR